MKPESEWPGTRVEMVPVEKLIPYARNARTHTPEQIDQIAASIVEFGWTMPVLVDPEGVLIAGHGRVMAAHKLGLARVPASVATAWTEAQIKAHRLTDNKLALNAGWDYGLLKIELEELSEMDFDLDLTGFGQLEVDTLLGDQLDGQDPAEAWQGMPEFQHENLQSQFRCIVHFASEADLHAFEELIGQSVPENTKAIWFPKAEREVVRNKRYASVQGSHAA
jgi:ParB-like chromosome segregation protein Spo0J